MSIVRGDTDAARYRRGDAADLFDLLAAAHAAVDQDRAIAQSCLARAIALLTADRNASTDPKDEVRARGQLPRWQARRLAAYIDEHLGAPIDSAALMAITGASAGHFFRTFKATFGEAPFAYIAKRRIERAQLLMLTTGKPLSEIALECGLCDQSHLTRLFRRQMGVTPRTWRREYAGRTPARDAG